MDGWPWDEVKPEDMGLLYPFPVSSEESGFIDTQLSPKGSVESVKVKTYGLPYLFWGYALASLAVIFLLWLAVRDSLEKLKTLGDSTDLMLVHALEIFIFILPVSILGFFFYEKSLERKGEILYIGHRVFGIPLPRKALKLAADAFTVDHHLDGPNVARMRGHEQSDGFQNKGYFTLHAKTSDGRLVLIDRHSRKSDLQKLKALLDLPSKPSH